MNKLSMPPSPLIALFPVAERRKDKCGNNDSIIGTKGSYKVTLVVAYLGGVDFDLDVPSSYLPALPVLPKSHLPEQNPADSRTSK